MTINLPHCRFLNGGTKFSSLKYFTVRNDRSISAELFTFMLCWDIYKLRIYSSIAISSAFLLKSVLNALVFGSFNAGSSYKQNSELPPDYISAYFIGYVFSALWFGEFIKAYSFGCVSRSYIYSKIMSINVSSFKSS